MRISIVTPCLNAARHIDETIDSVLRQRGDFEIEYVVVDGGSTDGTVESAGRYAAAVERGDFPIRCRGARMAVLCEKDEGMYDGLAKGLRRVTGDVAAYINADDFYLPNAFSVVAAVFRSVRGVRWLTGMTVSYNEEGQITEVRLPLGYSRPHIRGGLHGTCLPFIQQESTFFRRDLLESADLDRLRTCRFAGDFYLWHSFAGATDLDVVESCLAGFRRRRGQISADRARYLEEFLAIADPPTLRERLAGRVLRKADRFLTAAGKRRWNGRIIRFRENRWCRRVDSAEDAP